MWDVTKHTYPIDIFSHTYPIDIFSLGKGGDGFFRTVCAQQTYLTEFVYTAHGWSSLPVLQETNTQIQHLSFAKKNTKQC